MTATKSFKRQLISIYILLIAITSYAQIGTPKNPTYGNVLSTASANYYDELIGLSGTELKNKLKTIVVNASTKGQTYGDIWLILEEADENPLNNTQVWQMYVESGVAKSAHVSNGVGWNREHIFPQSRGGFSDGTSTSSDGKYVFFSTSSSQITHAHGDAHHLRAEDNVENSTRGDLDFGNVNGPRTKNSSYYEPPLSAKGDVSRSLFYMAIRYDALNVANGDQSGQTIGDLVAMLQWHVLDPPDDFEMRRNNVVYDWQNNRNPFIDMPDLVDYIWGSKQGQAWPGQEGNPIVLSGTLNFPMTKFGTSSEVKTYTISGTGLGTTLTVDAPAHFEISLTNNVANFTKHLDIAITDGTLNETSIYVRCTPESAVGGALSGNIAHASGEATANMPVSGTEGDPALLPVEIYTQNFESSCAPDWQKISVASNKDWACTNRGHNGGNAIEINNYNADANSEDWLISPLIDMSNYNSPEFKYWIDTYYSGSTLQLMYSTNYSGSGNPNAANWIKLNDVALAVGWSEKTVDLNSLGKSSYYLAFKHVSGTTANNATRINLDDIRILARLDLSTSMTISTDTINFEYTTGGTSSTTYSYTVNGQNLANDIIVTAESPFEISENETNWTNSITVSKDAASNKVIYVRFSPVSNYIGVINKTISLNSAGLSPLQIQLIAAANPSFTVDAATLTRDKTLDIVTWNLQYFGVSNQSSSNFPAKLASVTSTILTLDADIYALQEIILDNVNGDYLTPLVEALNAQAGAGTYTGIYGPRYSLDWQTPSATWPSQRVCYIYKTANFANIQSESMFSALIPNGSVTSIPGYTGTASLFWSSGRTPFRMKADVTIDGKTETIEFINIHAKCCSDSYDRKKADALFLKAELDNNYDTKNVIVLGDYNDYYIGSMTGGQTDSPYKTWFENGFEDYYKASAGNSNAIDHISISNELYFENQSLTNNSFVGTTTVSDHKPVVLRLLLDDQNFEGQYITMDPIANKPFSTTPFALNAISSTNSPVFYEVVSGPATLSGNMLTMTNLGTVVVRAFNPGDENTAPASDTKQFDIVKGGQTITFDLPASADVSAGSITLSATSTSGLPVTFSIASGNGTINNNQLSFTQAGNITVMAAQAGNDKYYAAAVSKTITITNTTSVNEIEKTKLNIYPNPSEGVITVNHTFTGKSVVAKIYSTSGKFIELHRIDNGKDLNLKHLKSGMYILSIESEGKAASEYFIIK